MTRSIRPLVVAVLLSLIVATTWYGHHSWGHYHWARTTSPFTLKTGDNVNSAWDSYLNGAIADWNLSVVLDLQKVTGRTTGTACQPTLGRDRDVQRCIWHERLARGRADLDDQRLTHRAGRREDERFVLQHCNVQQAGVAPPRDVPGDRP